MSDYRLEFGSMIGPRDTDRLYDLLSIVSKGDELEISMASENPEQINTVIDVLRSNSFDVSQKGSDTGHQCRIIAHRIE
jgi:hypothetical protein